MQKGLTDFPEVFFNKHESHTHLQSYIESAPSDGQEQKLENVK